MTHIRNIPHVLQYGITHRRSPNANPDFVPIGDGSLISTRDQKQIMVTNGADFPFGAKMILLGSMIPFYFAYRTPMLYVIQGGHNGVQKQTPDRIVYCVCSVQTIIDQNLEFYFTDGHAIDKLSICYDSTYIDRADQLLDWNSIAARDWKVELDMKRKKEAEFLAAADVPPACIIGFVCFNEAARQKLLSLGVQEKQIHIQPNFYF
jgi:hypothetical protein